MDTVKDACSAKNRQWGAKGSYRQEFEHKNEGQVLQSDTPSICHSFQPCVNRYS